MAADGAMQHDAAASKDPLGLVPAAEVARLFGRTLRTLSNWEKSGFLVPVRFNKRRYYRISDLERLLQQHSQEV